MRFLLHIGDAKCGSSAIQSALFQARADLLKRGILYNPVSSNSGHYFYASLIGQNIRMQDDIPLRRARDNLEETQAMLAEHKPDFVLLSGENFFAASPDRVAELCGWLQGGGPVEMNVAAFLRHPLPFYLSSVQQVLKGSHIFPSPSEMRYRKTASIKSWRAHPQCKAMEVGLFDRDRLRDGSVLVEFGDMLTRLTGRDCPELLEAGVNVSHSAEQMILMQAYRARYFPEQPNVLQPASTELSSFFHALNDHEGLVGTRSRLKPAVAAEILKIMEDEVTSLDRILPDLRMAESQQGVVGADGRPAAIDVKDVTSILADYDPAIRDRLADLIPECNPELLDDTGALAARLDTFGASARQVYARYLKRRNHAGPAERLLSWQSGS